GAASQVNVEDAVTAIRGYVETIPAVLARIEHEDPDPEAGRLLILMQSCFLAGPGTIRRMGPARLLPQAYAAWQLLILAQPGRVPARWGRGPPVGGGPRGPGGGARRHPRRGGSFPPHRFRAARPPASGIAAAVARRGNADSDHRDGGTRLRACAVDRTRRSRH